MLVDDDGVCLAILARGLRRRGFVVSTYSDPRTAMNCLVDELPDAVVTDMRMPHMTGLEVVQDIHAQLGAKAPPVLVVSSDGEERLLVEAFRLGAADYLLKPVSEVELGVKLSRAVTRKGVGLAIPRQVGEWVLGECVGRGGTAAVFKATRESEPETTYALKVIWPHLTGNTETLLRFRREIDTLSNLEHPRLVRFVMSGRAEECFYYVMSYIAGGTLRGKIKAQGAHTEDQALDLIERVADPLGFMHSQGLVHRDVKPGNIFYTHDDVVLGDFGLTKRIPDRGITLEEEFIGTPLYLAPEVFQSAEFGPTVDFYSLGVCAMEMLLGHAVLDEKDSMRLIGRILNEGLPSPRELLPDASEPMTVLLECLLSRDPAERPADAAAVAEAVRVARGTG